jgi:hypothetical protein
MIHESILARDWASIVKRLGGAKQLDISAGEPGILAIATDQERG